MKSFGLFITESQEIDVDGVMKYRINSEGKPIHPTDEGIRNFYRWFGGSKTIDDQGRPLVVYHASTYGDIDVFNTRTAFGKAGYGAYFSDRKGANLFAEYGQRFQMPISASGSPKKTNITPVYLKIVHPYEADHVDDLLPHQHIHGNQQFGVYPEHQKTKPNIVGPLEAKGYDGILTRETTAAKVHARNGLRILDRRDPKATSFPVYVVFHPNQIKSSLGNSGKFSNSSRIDESQ